MEIRFVSGNQFKIDETIKEMKGSGIDIIPFKEKIEELQTLNVEHLVRDKLMKAFSLIGRPLIVEHTGLYIKYLNDFPAGLTQIFWDCLEVDRFAELMAKLPDTTAIAKTIVGYCDGRQIYYFKGEVSGNIIDTPRGNLDFQWDCLFIPAGEKKTFAEMGKEKCHFSMRRLALEELKKKILDERTIDRRL